MSTLVSYDLSSSDEDENTSKLSTTKPAPSSPKLQSTLKTQKPVDQKEIPKKPTSVMFQVPIDMKALNQEDDEIPQRVVPMSTPSSKFSTISSLLPAPKHTTQREPQKAEQNQQQTGVKRKRGMGYSDSANLLGLAVSSGKQMPDDDVVGRAPKKPKTSTMEALLKLRQQQRGLVQTADQGTTDDVEAANPRFDPNAPQAPTQSASQK